MRWQCLLRGLSSARVDLFVHVFGGGERRPFLNDGWSANRYDFGCSVGVRSPLLGVLGKANQAANRGGGYP